MGDKVGENPVALRAAVSLPSAKNRRGVFKHPPAGRRLKFIRSLSSLPWIMTFCKHECSEIEITKYAVTYGTGGANVANDIE